MDPNTISSLRAQIQMDFLPYCECEFMTLWICQQTGWIYDLNGSGIQILGIRFWDSFSGSTDMSG